MEGGKPPRDCKQSLRHCKISLTLHPAFCTRLERQADGDLLKIVLFFFEKTLLLLTIPSGCGIIILLTRLNGKFFERGEADEM